ncbi:MAG: formylglycine-generating enzyme family protein, partial [Lentimicrobium sp.]|nr:formylglycine-generating enzyme family protein [Lentimicrobium sp.]
FADWMGCRMPTEAEWEYACRAGTSSPFHSGNCLSTSQANYNGNNPYRNCKNGNFQKKTLPVGSFAPNSWGLYDMHGNVWEWCTDWYLFEFTIEIQTNPVGPTNGYKRVVRGGSWRDYALDCRAASRFTGDPYRCFSSIGFRLVSTE